MRSHSAPEPFPFGRHAGPNQSAAEPPPKRPATRFYAEATEGCAKGRRGRLSLRDSAPTLASSASKNYRRTRRSWEVALQRPRERPTLKHLAAGHQMVIGTSPAQHPSPCDFPTSSRSAKISGQTKKPQRREQRREGVHAADLCVLRSAIPQNRCAPRSFFGLRWQAQRDTALGPPVALAKRRGAALPAAVQNALVAAPPHYVSAVYLVSLFWLRLGTLALKVPRLTE